MPALQHPPADAVLEGDGVEVQQQSDLAMTQPQVCLKLGFMQWQDVLDGLDLQQHLVADDDGGAVAAFEPYAIVVER
jgi:hypothetical protein